MDFQAIIGKVEHAANNEHLHLVIFFGYILLGISLTTVVLRTVNQRYVNLYLNGPHSKSKSSLPAQATYSRGKATLFRILAPLSLFVTSYQMANLFASSYLTWAELQGPDMPQPNMYHISGGVYFKDVHLVSWLESTSLFEEIWAVACANNYRYWWTSQIFYFAILWSYFLGLEGTKKRIPHLWAFSLLANTISLSFSMNLFFLALLLTSNLRRLQATKKPGHTKPLHPAWSLIPFLYSIQAVLGICSILLVNPTTSSFPLLILGFYIVIFVPVLIPKFVPRIIRFYRFQMQFFACVAVVWMAWITYQVLDTGRVRLKGVIEALGENPIMGGIGWDVIFCWISWFAWFVIGE